MKEVNKRFDIPVIYVTSFADNDTFQEAKKTFPAAYIVKPYIETEMQRAIELAIYNKHDDIISSKPGNNVVRNNHIYIKEGNALIKIELKSIQFIEAYDKYCFICTPAKRSVVRTRFKDIQEQLPDSLFIQVHRSIMVNLDLIDKIGLNGKTIHIAGKEISVSKTYKQNLFAKLNCIA